MRAEIAVGHKKSRTDSGERKKPFCIREPHLRGTCPDFLLVEQKIRCQPGKAVVVGGRQFVASRNCVECFFRAFFLHGFSLLRCSCICLLCRVLGRQSSKSARTCQPRANEPSQNVPQSS